MCVLSYLQMESLQKRVNLLSKEFEKLKNFQNDITEHLNEQLKYEDCWNQCSTTNNNSNNKNNNKNNVMTSSNEQTNNMIDQSKDNNTTRQQFSTNTTKMNEKDFAPLTSSTVPLMMNTTSSTLTWQEIEINNLTSLLNCTKPKKFFRLAVDFHDVKASLKNQGRLAIKSHLFQSMCHYSKDIIDRYVLLQESSLNNSVYSRCLIGVALVINAQTISRAGGGDKEIHLSYLSLSRTSRDLSEITMNEVGKIKEMLSTHIKNLKKKSVLPFICDIYVGIQLFYYWCSSY